MATTRVEYEQSLAALERDAIERPFLFYTRLVATILAGILPIALALATFIICFHRARLDTLALLLFLPLFKLFISFLLTLLKPITNPSGIELHRRTAPKLFSTIQSLCHRLKVPFPDHILLDESFNAYVSITHRRFFIGRKNYLVLGLPLMTYGLCDLMQPASSRG